MESTADLDVFINAIQREIILNEKYIFLFAFGSNSVFLLIFIVWENECLKSWVGVLLVIKFNCFYYFLWNYILIFTFLIKMKIIIISFLSCCIFSALSKDYKKISTKTFVMPNPKNRSELISLIHIHKSSL